MLKAIKDLKRLIKELVQEKSNLLNKVEIYINKLKDYPVN